MREEDSEFGGTGRAGNLPEKKRGRDGKRDEFGGGRTGRVPKEKWRGEKNGGRGMRAARKRAATVQEAGNPSCCLARL